MEVKCCQPRAKPRRKPRGSWVLTELSFPQGEPKQGHKGREEVLEPVTSVGEGPEVGFMARVCIGRAQLETYQHDGH